MTDDTMTEKADQASIDALLKWAHEHEHQPLRRAGRGG
jgi:hypothetical protein